MSISVSKFIGRKATKCRRCDGSRHYVNKMGGVLCNACSPPSKPEQVIGVILESGGIWVAEGDEFTPIADIGTPAGRPTSNADAVARRESQPITTAAPVTAIDRTDPPEPNRLILVDATRLEWFEASRDSIWGSLGPSGAIEVVGAFSASGWPAPGVYRPLSQPYFAWLLSAIDRLPELGAGDSTPRAEALAAIREIVVAAVDAGVFGEWAVAEQNWPRVPPAGYAPPRPMPVDQRWMRDWEGNLRRSRRMEEAFERIREEFGLLALAGNPGNPGRAA